MGLVEEQPTPETTEGRGRFWTVSNGLSLLRVVLTAPTLYYLALGASFRWHVFWLVMVLIVSDILDGAVARARNEITEWGKIIDPVADKIAIDSIAAFLVYLKGLPLWVAAAVIGRDILIVAAGAVLASRVKEVPSSNFWGKGTTLVMAFLLLTYAMDFEPPKAALLGAAALFLIGSSFSYAVRVKRFLFTADSD